MKGLLLRERVQPEPLEESWKVARGEILWPQRFLRKPPVVVDTKGIGFSCFDNGEETLETRSIEGEWSLCEQCFFRSVLFVGIAGPMMTQYWRAVPGFLGLFLPFLDFGGGELNITLGEVSLQASVPGTPVLELLYSGIASRSGIGPGAAER